MTATRLNDNGDENIISTSSDVRLDRKRLPTYAEKYFGKKAIDKNV